jgi:hypothetical protein
VSNPAPPLDGELAWAISAWPPDPDWHPLTREQIESLARHLTASGFGKVTKDDGVWRELLKLKPYFEEMFPSIGGSRDHTSS